MRIPAPRSRRLMALSGLLPVLVLALSGGLVAACGGGGTNPTAMPTMAGPASSAAIPAAAAQDSAEAPDSAASETAIEAAWAARPAYVRQATERVQSAYRYALERPDVIAWMACYCGCASMGHTSNLDCFVRARMSVGAVAFDEHASYCDVCVQTALLAKQRIGEGRSLAEIRAEVDATFGASGVSGTPTDLPKG